MWNSVNTVHDDWHLVLYILANEETRHFTSKSEVEIMRWVGGHQNNVYKVLAEWINYLWHKDEFGPPIKSNMVSYALNQKGKEFFNDNKFFEALQVYTQCLTFAHTDEYLYPLALYKRARTLYELTKYKEALEDTEVALSNNIADTIKTKVYMKQADCYIALNRPEEAKTALMNAKNCLPLMNFTDIDDNPVELTEQLYTLEMTLEQIDFNETHENHEGLVLSQLEGGKNSNYVSASIALEIKHSESLGRYVSARESLDQGNVLFVEKPYAFIVHREVSTNMSKVCEMCTKYKINPIPCSQCTHTMYCSENCRIEHWNLFHQWECKGAQWDLWPAIGNGHLALRCLLVAMNNGFHNVYIEDSTPITASMLFNTYSMYSDYNLYHINTPEFLRMFNLVTNFDKIVNTTYIEYSITAVMLMQYLKSHINFLTTVRAKIGFEISNSELEHFLSALLLRFLGQIYCNATTITSLTVGDNNDYNIDTIGVGIYPSISIMNHSCDPNVISWFNGIYMTVRCLRTIPLGERVENCYGPHRANLSTVARRKKLFEDYYFDCQCSACINPRDFYQQFHAYSCPNCQNAVLHLTSICQTCQSCTFQLSLTLSVKDRVNELIFKANLETNLHKRTSLISMALKSKQKIFHRNNMDLRLTMDILVETYTMSKEYTSAINLLKKIIPVTEYQYGTYSKELAEKLNKMSCLMMARLSLSDSLESDHLIWSRETLSVIRKSLVIFNFVFGLGNPISNRLRLQKLTLSSSL